MNLDELTQHPSARALFCLLVVWFCHMHIRITNMMFGKENPENGKNPFTYSKPITVYKYALQALCYWMAAYAFNRADDAGKLTIFMALVAMIIFFLVTCATTYTGSLDLGMPKRWRLWNCQSVVMYGACAGLYLCNRHEPFLSLQPGDAWCPIIIAAMLLDAFTGSAARWLCKRRFGWDLKTGEDLWTKPLEALCQPVGS